MKSFFAFFARDTVFFSHLLDLIEISNTSISLSKIGKAKRLSKQKRLLASLDNLFIDVHIRVKMSLFAYIHTFKCFFALKVKRY